MELGTLGPTCVECGREEGHGPPNCAETLRRRTLWRISEFAFQRIQGEVLGLVPSTVRELVGEAVEEAYRAGRHDEAQGLAR